jgi:hypothetical protein
MKRYLLRRNNEEIGPFSLEDLKTMKLQHVDLVWIIGESTNWQYSDKIEELSTKVLIGSAEPMNVHAFMSNNQEFKLLDKPVNIGHFFYRILVEKILTPSSQISWFLVVAAVLMFDFFIIKAIVQGLNYNPTDYIAIKNALQKDPPTGNTDNNYQNALVKEIISASDTGQKTNITKPAKTKEISLAEMKKLVQIKNNNYHVITAGGIDDLELTVFNNSAFFIEAVTVQVDYLEVKGQLVQTEAFTTNFVKPKSSKTIHVPSNSKGAKIKFRITNVKSPECVSRKLEA